MSIFGNQFSFHNSDPKIIDVLFFCRYPLASSFLPPLVFFLMFIWAAISYQLQEYIHRIWMNSVQWLPEIWQLVEGSFLRISNCILLMFSVVKKCQFLETNFLFTIQIQKLLTYCFFGRYPLASSFLPPLVFFWCLFGLPSVISCRNTYIEYGWIWYMC